MRRRKTSFILIAFGILITGPLEELQAIIGRPATPVSVAGSTRRVARRTARRTTVRVAAVTTPVTTTIVVAEPAAPAAPSGLPVGTAVAALPGGCTSLTVNGLTYYQCNGVYYQPQYSGGNLVYVVTAPPM
jgi:hypothetical protein